MILDELMEKKDLLAYIDFRIKILEQERKNYIEDNKNSLENRHICSCLERFYGRILELEELKTTICQNTLKDKSKSYYRKINMR